MDDAAAAYVQGMTSLWKMLCNKCKAKHIVSNPTHLHVYRFKAVQVLMSESLLS